MKTKTNLNDLDCSIKEMFLATCTAHDLDPDIIIEALLKNFIDSSSNMPNSEVH